METSEIRKTFIRVYNNEPNIMTPEIVRYGQSGQYLYELSQGEFMNEIRYGITVLKPGKYGTTYVKDHEKSKCLHNTVDAEQYILELAA